MKTRELKKLIVFILTFAIILSQMVIFVSADDIDSGDYFVSLRMDGTIGVNLYINYSDYERKFTTSPVITLSYPDETTKAAAFVSEQYSTNGASYQEGQIKDVSNVYDVNHLKGDTVSIDEARILGNPDIAGWSKISCAVAPALINKTITFTVSSEGSDKTYKHSFTVKGIAKKYVDEYSKLTTSADEATKETAKKIVALCQSLLSYGDAAYTYFSKQPGYGFAETSDAALFTDAAVVEKYYNAPLATKSAIEPIEGNSENTVTVEDYDKEFEIVKTSLASIRCSNEIGSTYSAVKDITMGGFSFTCVSNTYMRYKFKMTESAVDKGETITYAAFVNFTNASISAMSAKLSAEISVDNENADPKEYSIRVKGIPAVCLGEEYEVILKRYVLDAEHATIEDPKESSEIYSFKGSAMAYANRVFGEGYAEGTDSEKNLKLEKIMMMAAYRYYLAASDYFSIAR